MFVMILAIIVQLPVYAGVPLTDAEMSVMFGGGTDIDCGSVIPRTGCPEQSQDCEDEEGPCGICHDKQGDKTCHVITSYGLDCKVTTAHDCDTEANRATCGIGGTCALNPSSAGEECPGGTASTCKY